MAGEMLIPQPLVPFSCFFQNPIPAQDSSDDEYVCGSIASSVFPFARREATTATIRIDAITPRLANGGTLNRSINTILPALYCGPATPKQQSMVKADEVAGSPHIAPSDYRC